MGERQAEPSRWWLATLVLGLVTLAISLYLGTIFPAEAAAMLPGYGTPVIAFEFASTQADLTAIFGGETDPQQIARLLAMRAGNEQDYGFMLVYAGFLACGCLALWRETRLPLLRIAAVLPILAALFDAYENLLLFDTQTAFTLGEQAAALDGLWVPVAAKFALLALTNVAIGTAMMQLGKGWRLTGLIVVIACLAVVMALITPAAFGWMLAPAIGAGWFALLVLAGVRSWRAVMRKKVPDDASI